MIVRILGEGQYRVPSGLLDQLNEADNQLVVAAANDDADAFRRLYQEMLEMVRDQGAELPVEELHPSDVILPAPDVDFQEAKELFAGEGLIPG